MDARILEIIKSPSDLMQSDLTLLQSEIERYPYAQSLRAVHLIGVQKFDNELFNRTLSEVAAYTADKKNLYKILHPQAPAVAVNENQKDSMKDVSHKEIFISDEIQQSENLEAATGLHKLPAEEEKFSEEIIVEDKGSGTSESVADTAEISFHGVDDFLSKVKFTTSAPPENAQPLQKPAPRTDDEMQRLIAEVEAKMKAKSAKKNRAAEEDFTENSAEIDFYESAVMTDNRGPAETFKDKGETEVLQEWKPMPFGGLEVPQNHSHETEILGGTKASDPVLKSEEQPDLNEEKAETGNVGKFINTWQAWLQLGKTAADNTAPEEISEPPKDKKSAAIESFIENEPKISKLRKEEFPAAKKERGDNISHLMTETLAKIYTEQKLYGKATEAYEILKKKFPERVVDFDGKINQIKELRQNMK